MPANLSRSKQSEVIKGKKKKKSRQEIISFINGINFLMKTTMCSEGFPTAAVPGHY